MEVRQINQVNKSLAKYLSKLKNSEDIKALTNKIDSRSILNENPKMLRTLKLLMQ